MDVVIDGVRYIPEPEAGSSIAVGVKVHNRPGNFPRFLDSWSEYAPEGARLFIVDDASDKPVTLPEGVDATLFRFDSNVGIARSNNKLLSLMMSSGAEHFFLADDDMTFTGERWWEPFLRSGDRHLMYMWGSGASYRDDEVVGYTHPFGCFLYIHRSVVDAIGGFDPRFGIYGGEHQSFSDRAHNAGFSRVRYGCPQGVSGLLRCADESGNAPSSVSETDRKRMNHELVLSERDQTTFVPLDSQDAGAPTGRPRLSILVPSTHTRYASFAPKIQKSLYDQFDRLDNPSDVEILFLADTKSRVLGDKRNQMVSLAAGDYVVFVDDDDRIADDYISSLLSAISESPDVVTFNAEVTLNGGRPKKCVYSLRFDKDENTSTEYRRLPNHLCAVRRSLALRTPFPSKTKGEDSEYARDLKRLLDTEVHLDRTMYYYDYNDATTETQAPAREVSKAQGEIVKLAQTPVADIVILSKASSDEYWNMTQRAIDTAIGGADPHPVNVIVIEQVPDAKPYRNAVTLFDDSPFTYNKRMNAGASKGLAPWIVFANNDLVFRKGWLSALLRAKYPIVSPKITGDARQRSISRNTQGWTNGVHFSGCCFMMQRSVWERIGGLDEMSTLWTADDVVIEQLRAIGHRPMVVPASQVDHLVSRTMGKVTVADGGDDGRDTWLQVELFNRRFKANKFANDPRYAKWKKDHLRDAHKMVEDLVSDGKLPEGALKWI